MTFGHRAHSARVPGCRATGLPARVLVAALLALSGLAAPLPAQTTTPPTPTPDPIHRPQSANRVVRVFTFEEPNNPHPVPDHWFHAQDDPAGIRRPGFPAYNQAVFDQTQSASGTTSVRLPTQGGSTSLRLAAGEVPIFPDADYTVSAKIRTQDLEFSRAFLSARLLDQRLKPIPASEIRSEPVLSPGAWTTVSVIVSGKSAAAAWLQIDLELLQPAQFEPPPANAGIMAQFRVPHEDIAGGAFFDDVSIALLPRTRFWTEQPSGLFIAPETPTFGMLARDQGGDDLSARVRILDIDGRTVAEQSFKLDPSARPISWSPKLPGFGWFRAIMEIDAAQVNVTRTELSLVSLPAPAKISESPRRAADLARFGIIADKLPEHLLAALPNLTERSRTHFVVLPAFDAQIPVDQARAALAARAPAIDRLAAQGQEITLALGAVPPSLVAKEMLDPTDALGMCENDPRAWSPYLEPTLDVYGQRILRYQLGAAGDIHALRRDPTLGLESFERTISRLVPGPRVGLAWRADHPLPRISRSPSAAVDTGKPASPSNIAPGPLVDSLVSVYPSGFAPRGMNDLALAWREQVAAGNPMELTVVPELPPSDRFGPRARAVDAARRIAEFWAALGSGDESSGKLSAPAPRLALDAPWKVVAQREEDRLLPGPELPVLALMAERLSGRRLVGAVPAPPGVRAFLLAEPAGSGGSANSQSAGEALVRACVVAWNESAEPDRAWVEVYPARASVDIADIFGNVTPLSPATADMPPSNTGARGTGSAGVQIRVPLTDAPVFIEGVDPYLAQFTSSFLLTPNFIPATDAAHDAHIEMTNPWPVRITGQIQLKEAETPRTAKAAAPALRSAPWTISPNVIEFAIAPGQTASLPLSLEFGSGQLAGTKDFVLLAKVFADRQYPPIRATTSVQIGLPDLELIPDVQFTPTPNGPDVIIIAAVTNKDTRARTLRLEIAAGEIPSQQLQISDLPPAQTIFKHFVIRDGARLLAGRHVRVTLSDDESAARLSKAAFIPDAR